MEPAGSCLVAAPLELAGGVAGRFWVGKCAGEQAPDLGDGERDEAGSAGGVASSPAGAGLGICPVPEHRGGDGADRERGHDQHDVPRDRGAEPGLALVQAEAALPELKALFGGLITNGKFCCVRRVRLSLGRWHRPLRLRGSVLQSDLALAGKPDDPGLDRGLSAAGGVGRAGQRAGSGADR